MSFVNLKDDSKCNSQITELYEAEKLLGKKIKRGKSFYKVKWKGYDTKESTWEPIDSFSESSMYMIELYDQELKEKSEKYISQLKKKEKFNGKKDGSFLNGLNNSNKTNSINSNEDTDEPRFSKRLINAKTNPIKKYKKIQEICLGDYGVVSSSEAGESSFSSDVEEKKCDQDSAYDSYKSMKNISEEDSDTESKKSCDSKKAEVINLTEDETIRNIKKERQENISQDKCLNCINNKIVDRPIVLSKSESQKWLKNPVANIQFDKVLRILNARIQNTDDVELNCLLEFGIRPNGQTPDSKWISSKLLKIHHPALLLEFYESRICRNQNKKISDNY